MLDPKFPAFSPWGPPSPGSGSGGLGDRVHHFSGRSLGGSHPLGQGPGGETKEKLGEMGDKYGRMISNGGDDLDF